jgi:hypothetical protein
VPEQVEAIIQVGIDKGEFPALNARLLSWQLVALVEVALRPYSRRILGNPQQMSDYVVTMFLHGITTLSPVQAQKS